MLLSQSAGKTTFQDVFKHYDTSNESWDTYEDSNVYMSVQSDSICIPIVTKSSSQENSCILLRNSEYPEEDNAITHDIILGTIEKRQEVIDFDAYTTYGIYNKSRKSIDKQQFIEMLDDLNIFDIYQSTQLIEDISLYTSSKDFGNCEIFIGKLKDSQYNFFITLRDFGDSSLLFEISLFNDKITQDEMMNIHYTTVKSSEKQEDATKSVTDIWKDINSYRTKYSENYIDTERIVNELKIMIPCLRYSEEDTEYNISQDITRNSTDYSERQLELTEYNRNPMHIQGYKYMKSVGVYQVDTTENSEKQYSLIGQTLPIMYDIYGNVITTVQNSVTAVWVRTGDFQYRVECPDISELEYRDTLLDDYISQQKSMYDNSSDSMFYTIYDSEIDKNHRTLTILHTTKDINDDTFNVLTDLDTLEVIDYRLEKLINGKPRITVQKATTYNGWFNRFSQGTVEAYSEWMNINGIKDVEGLNIITDIFSKITGTTLY